MNEKEMNDVSSSFKSEQPIVRKEFCRVTTFAGDALGLKILSILLLGVTHNTTTLYS